MKKATLARLPDGPVKTWYETYGSENLDERVSYFEKQGYSLDECGLLFREPVSKEIVEEVGQTMLDIVFPRPTDFHYHEDVLETVKILSGSAWFIYNHAPYNYPRYPVFYKKGNIITIPKLLRHCFKPEKSHEYPHEKILEVRLVCSDILDPEQEIYVKRFDKWT